MDEAYIQVYKDRFRTGKIPNNKPYMCIVIIMLTLDINLQIYCSMSNNII